MTRNNVKHMFPWWDTGNCVLLCGELLLGVSARLQANANCPLCTPAKCVFPKALTVTS